MEQKAYFFSAVPIDCLVVQSGNKYDSNSDISIQPAGLAHITSNCLIRWDTFSFNLTSDSDGKISTSCFTEKLRRDG